MLIFMVVFTIKYIIHTIHDIWLSWQLSTILKFYQLFSVVQKIVIAIAGIKIENSMPLYSLLLIKEIIDIQKSCYYKYPEGN